MRNMLIDYLFITLFTNAHSVPALGIGCANRFLLRLLTGETRTERCHHENHLKIKKKLVEFNSIPWILQYKLGGNYLELLINY